MKATSALFLLANVALQAGLATANKRETPPWYAAKAADAHDANVKREVPPWYAAKAADAEDTTKRETETPPWYAAKAADAEDTNIKRETPPWYAAKASDAEDVNTKRETPPWYAAKASDAEDANTKRETPPWYAAKAADAEDANIKRETPPWYAAKAADAEDANTKRETPPWYAAKAADAEDSNTKRETPPWYAAKAADAEDSNTKRETPPWYAAKASDAEDTNMKRETPPWYAAKAADAEDSNMKRETPPWYAAKAADAEDTNMKRETPPWYAAKAADAADANMKRETPPWYAAKASDAKDSNTKRETPPWYAAKAADASDAADANNKRETPPWYAAKAADAEDANMKRETPPWYAAKAADANNEGITKRQLAMAERQNEAMRVRSIMAPAVLARYLNGGSAGGVQARSAMSLAEHRAASEKLEAEVYGAMRDEALRETSDRGRTLLEFTVEPASDRVDRDHVPENLAELVAGAINEQEKVALLNYYLLVTGREPRVATELGWNRTLEAPALLEKSEEVGYGYALGSQHQHHCANMLADAIDLGKDNINDFWMFHVIHCLSLIKIYAEKLADYKEPVQPLTGPARDRLLKEYGMADWEDDDGNIIKQGMLQRNPKFGFLTDSFCLQKNGSGSDGSLRGWVIFLIVEATISSLALCGMVGRALWTKRDEKRRYIAVDTGRVVDIEEKPFLDN